ncbi:MAG TPA: chemotaxis protein CheW [Candidatus Saccharimonadales bacterium]|nr:chemotaxis protein CheW [Candidatus Saccharimonadales bacterium]
MSGEAAPQAAPSRQVVVFQIGHEEYAAPIEQVREVVKTPNITLTPNGQDAVVGVINLRGQIVPVLDLEKLFHLPEADRASAQHIVVSEDDAHALFGVQVERVLEVLRIANDAIKPTPKMVAEHVAADYLDGVVILESDNAASQSGRMILLVNLQKIIADRALDQPKQEGSVVTQ